MAASPEKTWIGNTAVAIVSAAFLLAVAAFAITSKDAAVNPQTQFLLRIGAALGAAGLAATLPGFIELQMSPGKLFSLKAGGALAVFALIYVINPPAIVSQCEQNSTRECLCPGARHGVQACSATGTWGACNCGFLGFCEPGAVRACPCAQGKAVQSCTADGMWAKCECPDGQLQANAPRQAEGAQAVARGKAGPDLSGVWRNASDTIVFAATGSGMYQLSGTTALPGGLYQLSGRAQQTGDTVQINLVLYSMNTPVAQVQATMTLESDRNMTGALTTGYGTSVYQLVKQ